jgi:hypothetical protein
MRVYTLNIAEIIIYLQRERLSLKTPQGEAIVRSTAIYKTVEISRNDLSHHKMSNKMEQVLLQNQESVLAWVSDKLAVAMRQGED